MAKCTLIATLVAKPERREDLLRILMSQIAPTRAEPGCIEYDLHVAVDDPCVFVFYENWRSRSDLDAHLKLPHLQPLLDRLDDLLSRPVDMKYLEILSDPAR